MHFSPQLASMLRSLTSIDSFATSLVISLSHLILSNLIIKVSASYVFLSHIHSPNLTYIDLSSVNLSGIPSSITMLDTLQDLIISSN
ncbi:hypothetical protein ACSQ67_001882 [Phaseolus vulgaris]